MDTNAPRDGALRDRGLSWEAIRSNLRTPGRRAGTAFPLLGAALLAVFALYALFIMLRSPSVGGLDRASFSQATVLYADDGTELSRYYEENRVWVPLDSISESMVEALIATEDRRFYNHWGIDVRRTFGAAARTVGGERQGGSTITMQLVRNAFPSVADDYILTRKMKEWFTALRIETKYSKNEILEVYLNTVPFMYNAFGVEAAARTYFNKAADELTVPESATLVGMLKGTTFYNPVRNPERSLERRNIVLDRMKEAGYLEPNEAAEYADEPLTVEFSPVTHEENRAPYFAEHVRKWLGDWAARRGYNPYTDGLRVYTTLDARLQAAAEEALKTEAQHLQEVADASWSGGADEPRFAGFWRTHPEVLERQVRQSDRFRGLTQRGMSADDAYARLTEDAAFIDSVKESSSRLQAAFLAIHPATGHIKAWVGGRNYTEDKFDHVSQARRQPGSTFKPFVYAAALDYGYAPDDLLLDQRVNYVDPHTGRAWRPGNFGSESGQPIPLRTALAQSKNTVTAQLILDIGPSRVASYARQMGIESELQAVPSLALGTSEVTLYEMTSAYTTIANAGVHQRPAYVSRIESRDGVVLATFDSEGRRAISGNVAYTLLDMMRGVVNGGTGSGIRRYGASGDLAGKTGTTQENADGWFMLMHPELVMGSWVGFNSPRVRFRSDYWGQGANNALRIVGGFLRQAQLPPARFSPPPGYVAPSSSRFRYAALDSLTEMEVRGYEFDSLRHEFGDRFGSDTLDGGVWEDLDRRNPDDTLYGPPLESERPGDDMDGETMPDPDAAAEPEEDIEELSEADRLNRQEREQSNLNELLEGRD